ncbi:MAG TPA: hypothetical protein VKG01_11580 [Thermoanaerobaculia bacterium]|nr:hypothetical protein [Thermoanaerobaculia bacterium]
MRPGRFLYAVTGLLSLTAAATIAVAQQQPIHGCNAAASCRPLGFSTLDKSSGLGVSFFGFGIRFGPGFELFLPTPPATPAQGQYGPSPTPRADLFHLNASLLPPSPAPTPVSTPSAAPSRAKS